MQLFYIWALLLFLVLIFGCRQHLLELLWSLRYCLVMIFVRQSRLLVILVRYQLSY